MGRKLMLFVGMAALFAACGREGGVLSTLATESPPPVTLAPTESPLITATPETSATPAVVTATPTETQAAPSPTFAAGKQGIYGSVKAGPTCPVENQASPCPDRPVPDAKVTATNQSGGPDGSTTTDAEGKFRLGLEPGRYKVTATSKAVQSCNTTTVDVKDHQYTPVAIDCDTGIR